MAAPFYKQLATSVAIGVVTSLITVWLLRKLSQPPAPAAIPANAAAGAPPLKGLREKGIPRNEF